VKAGFSYLKAAEGLGVEPRACLVFEDAIVGVQAERAVPHFEAVRWPV
jgi:HAD superfamily hydrolase (TIGR01509 family)